MSTLEYLYEKIKNILIKFTSWRNFETKAIFIARGTAQSARNARSGGRSEGSARNVSIEQNGVRARAKHLEPADAREH